MAIGSYDVGALVKISAAFTVAGAPTDPTSVAIKVVDPAGAATTPAIVHDSTGNYHANVDLTSAVAGLWQYRFSGTGACQAAEQNCFYVEPSI